jgi:DNA-binding transcriptional MerR regulator
MKPSELAPLYGITTRQLRRRTIAGLVPGVRQKTKGGHYRYADCPALRKDIELNRKRTGVTENEAIEIKRAYATAVKSKKLSEAALIDLANKARQIGIVIQVLIDGQRITDDKWRRVRDGFQPRF